MIQDMSLFVYAVFTCAMGAIEQSAEEILIRAGVAWVEFRVLRVDDDQWQAGGLAKGVLADLVKRRCLKPFD